MGIVTWYITNATEEPTGLCENSSSSGLRALCSFLSHSSEWRMVIYKDKSAVVISETLFFVFSFGFDFYTEKEQDEIMCLGQCTDWFQHYVQSGWADTDRNFTCSPPQMESSFSLFFPNSFWFLRINCSLQKDPSPETCSSRTEP